MIRSLLQCTDRAPAEATKTVSVVNFQVPEGTEALGLRFDYSPRESVDRAVNEPLVEQAFDLFISRRRPELGAEGVAAHRQRLGVDQRSGSLNNLMNVVLIDPSGRWRGRWDRRPPEESGDLVLSGSCASRGFVPGPISSGRWTAAIECHGVFGEPVNYQLDVFARAAPTDQERVALAERDFAEPARGPREVGWLFGELHSHSTHSDGNHEMADIADRAARAGLDFLALTDHNTMSAHPAPNHAPLCIVRGYELTTFHGHHPIYGMDELVPWHVDGRVRALGEVAADIRKAGGLVGVAHPFVPGDPLCTGCRMVDDLPPDSFDLMEVWYRRWHSPGSDNRAAYNYWNRLWAAGHRPVAVAARDWHRPEQEGPFPGEMPLTGIFAQEATEAAILDGLRRGRVIMSRGPSLALSIPGDDGGLMIGDRAAEDQLGGAPLRVDIGELDRGAELRMYCSGRILHQQAVAGDQLVECTRPGPGYYRAELWAGDEPLAITNHLETTAPAT